MTPLQASPAAAPPATSSLVDPRSLTRTQRDALKLIEHKTPARCARGYGRVGAFVTRACAARLIELKLARLDYSAAGVRLMLTGLGLNALYVMQQREARRAGK